MEQMANIRTILIGFPSSTREIIVTIEPPLQGEDRVLYDVAKMVLNMAKSLLNAMK